MTVPPTRVRLAALAHELPHVSIHLQAGRWCRAAEEALLGGSSSIEPGAEEA